MSTETEVCQIHGQFFTRFTLLNETPPKGYMWSGVRLTKIQTTSRPDHIWPDAWTRIGKAAQRREKQEWAIEKPKLEYARNLKDIYSIDPSDEDYTVATPCKREFSKASIRKFKESGAKTEFSCTADKDESTRQRIDFSTHRIHEGHNAGKEQNSVVYCNLFAKQVKPREGPNVTLRKDGFTRAPVHCACHRETVVMLQNWDSDPIRSDGDNWLTEDHECEPTF